MSTGPGAAPTERYGAATGLVVVAAGAGTRLGGGEPKALRSVRGVPMVLRALLPFVGLVQHACVVLPPGADCLLPEGVLSTVGGASRQASVDAGLRTLPEEVGLVLVHDAARPFVPPTVVQAVLLALAGGADAVIPVLPVVDTIKVVDPAGVVVDTPDRATLRAVQTPQGFRRAVLVAAHAAAGAAAATDDAGLVERAGGRVQTVPGSVESFKITTAADFEQAERVAAVLDG